MNETHQRIVNTWALIGSSQLTDDQRQQFVADLTAVEDYSGVEFANIIL